MTESPTHRPPALQERSRRSQQDILRAGYALLEEGGVDALTVAAVAERAGMAVGSVYRRFGDKEGLLLAIQHAFTENLEAEIRQRVSMERLRILRDPAVAVAEAVGAFTDAFQAHEALLRVFFLLGTRHEAVRTEGSQASVKGNRRFAEALAHVPVAHTDRAAALDFAYRLTYATIAHRITQGELMESDRPLPWHELRSHLQTAVVSYLLSPPQSP
ncbi:TetR/AcrR family transcriptional regulator [Streptomyces sp. NL15-2K]|uniref:TetR/AcrR family transcriptional regulator n=1 Tax=Streptomyces sp. NL15-2K TaxID=376149 RepID=UPI000F567505|nr:MULTISPECIES: TetR/AcrR family transcriptional regulator [Actinomycetes]WKX07106.1 helix-turn-helix domain-containing protein [Kutzneria buriramensis]GCB53557.1 tetR family transcriptional regulator [Streptomyces sp. NL15-2K]